MSPIQIGDRHVGPGKPCFVVAEIGINHNGDLDLAKRTIAAAAEVGADSVKFQNFRADDFVSDKSLTYEYTSQGKTVIETQYEMFKRYELGFDALHELKSYCDSLGLIFHSTPTSLAGIKTLVDIGTPVLKNGSDYLTHLPLIQAMGQTGLPTVLSTGMATLAEIASAVQAFRETGNEQLILLHCVSSYPTPAGDVNLRKISSLAAAFGCPIGFSDHTEGVVAALAACVLGACWVERHFTLDKNLPGPDHSFSADPTEFRNLVNAIRTMEQCLGDSQVGPTTKELADRQDYRLSCVTAQALPAGHVLTENNIAFQRPGTGIPPAHSYLLVGPVLGTGSVLPSACLLSLSEFHSDFIPFQYIFLSGWF